MRKRKNKLQIKMRLKKILRMPLLFLIQLIKRPPSNLLSWGEKEKAKIRTRRTRRIKK